MPVYTKNYIYLEIISENAYTVFKISNLFSVIITSAFYKREKII